MCDRPHDKAVRSPWTEGAWILLAVEVPEGWRGRLFAGDDNAWDDPTSFWPDSIVEAKP
jgi:hypothetical protein